MMIADQNGQAAGLLHELFEATADAHPDNVAVVCGDQRLTYRELESRANRLAHHLCSLGVRKDTFVALLLPRGTEAFVALLAALKAGAAYVPLDPDYPAERVGCILADCAAAAVITTRALTTKCGGQGAYPVLLDAHAEAIAGRPDHRLPPAEMAPSPDDLCYVIYTSGSTGRPKGVQIEHRSARHLVRAEGALFGVRPDDRVYQGFSLAFDASVEEVWLAFCSGAALVVGTADWLRSGPELGSRLAWAGVTVFSTVPTLLSMLDDDVPTVRLLILGGEACPQELVGRWCRPGRRMVNTYGPTEATVIATYADCDPARPITIGKPVPGYHVCLLDEQLRPVPPGATGEIHIGGPGLARGYLGRDDLTREKFVLTPDGCVPRLYRTGDLGRINADGDIEFLGRADTQVKLRGFRVELTEIESVLLECDGVRAAAVTVREDIPGVRQLVGYVVPREGAAVEEQRLRGRLRVRLPSYMVPAVIEAVHALPVLPSGKVDRGALPPPRGRESKARPDYVAPRTALEEKIATAWEKLFAPVRVSIRDDFFTDLGGHSLLAAGMVSELRKDPELAALSVRDVYAHPTVEALAAEVEAGAASGRAEPPSRRFWRVSSLAHFLCGLAQLPSLYAILAVNSLAWLAPYLAYTSLVEDDYDTDEALLGAFAALLAVYPAMLVLGLAVKWLVIGRFKAGEYPLWGTYFFRWWFVRAIFSAIPTGYLAGTPLLNLYYRLLGAKIGRGAYLGSDECFCFDLLAVGDGSSLGSDASLLGYAVEDGLLKLGPIAVGRRCYVGNSSVIREHASMGDESVLEDLSLLPTGVYVPAGEHWAGSPARPLPDGTAAARPDGNEPTGACRAAYSVLYVLGVMLIPSLVACAIFPGIILMNYLNYLDDYYWYLLVSPVVGVSFVVLLCLEIAAVKWLLLGRVRPGCYRVHGWFYWRKWVVDRMMELSLDVLGPLYATIYLTPWYRLLGARVGRRAEISTASFICPDLLQIDDEGFIADSVSLGAARVDRGLMTIGPCRVGKRSFIGNSALLPPCATVGDNCLIGCLSTVPEGSAAAKDGTSWLGSPAFFLPQRQESPAFGEERTFHPTRRLWVVRGAIEFFRATLPATCFTVLSSLLLSFVVLYQDDLGIPGLLLLFPLLYTVIGLVATLFTVGMKWLLMGRYRPLARPLWSHFVWRTELVTSLRDNLADLFLLDLLKGTPFLCWVIRLFGAKIGRRVFLDTTELSEFDLVRIGDDAALNHDCTMQTHLFEDRVMKMSTIDVGPRCSVGAVSLVLYDTAMDEGAVLGSLSLLMKGEVLPAWTAWEGIPAARRGEASSTKSVQAACGFAGWTAKPQAAAC
ncbi:MAG TPA: Pls/PosA family non-ribosomal peptide synthetase [Gemmataceae bacterium]|nr:Pls/PosA family non-ribosomal peptide synthetase [Gemmataceae bacterium]